MILEKKQKQAISTLCMIELWMTYRTLRKYFDIVLKPRKFELTRLENENDHAFADFNPQDKKVTHC